MANYSTLKAAVADVVKTNGSQAITGANLQTVLLSIINSIGGGGYIFNGVATPSTDAGTPDQNVFYIGGAGTYANFGTSVVVPPTNIAVFKYNGTWNCEQLTVENGGVFDISAFKAVGGTLATYADLAAALGTNGANVPEGIRKGGMSIKFVQSSDNKYMQFRLMAQTFSTNLYDWEERIDGILLASYNYSDLTEKGHYVTDNDVLGSFVSSNSERVKIFDIPTGAYLLKYNCRFTNNSPNRGVFFIDASNNILARRFSFDVDNSIIVPTGATKVMFCVLSSEFTASFYTFQQNPNLFIDSRNYFDFGRSGYYDEDGTWQDSTARRSIYEKIPEGTKKIYYRDVIDNDSNNFGIRLFDGNGNVLYYESMSRKTFRNIGLKVFPTATHYAFGVVHLADFTNYPESNNPYILFSSENTIDEDARKFSGKNVLIFGDSISKTEDPLGLTYPDYLASFCGANIMNCAIGGSHLSDKVIGEQGEESYYTSKVSVVSMIRAFCTQNFTSVDEAAEELDREDVRTAIANLKSVNRNAGVDYAIIMAGTNDYNFTPSGERGTTDTATIYGSIAYISTELIRWVRQILVLSNIVTWFDISNNKNYDFSNVKPSSYIDNGNKLFSRFSIENRATAFTTFKYAVPNNGIRLYIKTDLDIRFELSSMTWGVFDTNKFEDDGNHFLPMAFEYDRTESSNYIFSKVITSSRDNNSNPSSANPLFKNNTDYLLVANVGDKYYMMCYWDNGRYTAKEVSVVNDEITLASLETSFKHTWSTEFTKSRFSQNNGENLYLAHLFGRMKYELNGVIEQAAKDYNMPFGDMYYSLGWNVANFKKVCSDGFHPALGDGIKTIATRIFAYMKELFH